MINKVINDATEAVVDIRDGAIVGIGGFSFDFEGGMQNVCFWFRRSWGRVKGLFREERAAFFLVSNIA